jgi:hypothetical protein
MSDTAYRSPTSGPTARDRVLDACRRKGTTLRAWALDQGYDPGTVHRVVTRWGHRRDRRPQGVLADEILGALRGFVGARVLPAPRTRRAAPATAGRGAGSTDRRTP